MLNFENYERLELGFKTVIFNLSFGIIEFPYHKGLKEKNNSFLDKTIYF